MGATVVAIDPSKTRTAAAADVHIRPMPGTDAALALGMMHVIVAEGLHDERYFDRYTVGFERLVERLRITRPSTSPRSRGSMPTRSVISRARTRTRARQRSACSWGWSTTPTAPRRTAPSAVCPPWSAPGATAAAALCHMTFQLFGDIDWSCGSRCRRTVPFVPSTWCRWDALSTDPSMDPPIRALVVYNSNPGGDRAEPEPGAQRSAT